MSVRIVVVPINHGAGVTTTCLGLAHALDRRRVSVGYVKPFGRPLSDGEDTSAELFRLATPLRPPPPIPFAHVEEMLAAGHEDELMEEVLALASDVLGAHQVVVVEGLAREVQATHTTRLNIEIARALDADVVLVASAAGVTPERLVHQVSAMANGYRVAGGSRVLGVALNHVPDGQDDGRFEKALARAGHRTVSSMGHRPEFTRPRVRDVVHELGFEVVNAGDDRRRIGGTIVAAQSIPGFLTHLAEDRLVIVPGDRHEVLMSAALAEQSGTRLAAVLLTAGIRPDPDVLRLCRPALQEGLPLLFTHDLTFEATSKVVALDPAIPADDEDRARIVMRGAADAFDGAWLEELPSRPREIRVTPAAFRLASVQRAARGDMCIALTDAEDPRVLHAACGLQERGIVRCVLVGDPARIDAAADEAGLTLPFGMRVLDPAALDAATVRRIEGALGDADARVDIDGVHARDPLAVGLDLVVRGEVDGLVTGLGGQPHPVLDLTREVVGVREGTLLSSAYVLNLPDEVVVFTDCLLNEHPTAEELALIALSGADNAATVGITPRVALVSGRTGPEAEQERERLLRAAQLVRDRRPDLPLEGPVPFDEVFRSGSGSASVFVFSDLATASATFRAVAREAGVPVFGPLMLGLQRPVNIVVPHSSAMQISDRIVATAVQAGLYA